MKLKSDLIHKICAAQHKAMVCKIYLKDSTWAYTQDEIGKMVKDLQLKEKLDKYTIELHKLIDEIDEEDVRETFTDKAYVQLPENQFTLEMQRDATNEVIGKRLTLEEVMKAQGML